MEVVRGAGLLSGGWSTGEATALPPSQRHSSLTFGASRPRPDPRLPSSPSLSCFNSHPVLRQSSPGGEAHSGRGMQRLISDARTAELGAAAARHGSTS